MSIESRQLGVRWSTFLVYVSLAFLGLWLLRSGHLRRPEVHDALAFSLSLLLVLSGFIASAVAWWQLLRVYSHEVPFRVALSSTGLTVFGKYVPGKVWTVVGRAGYIAERSTYPVSALAALSVTGQIIAIWLGLVFGASILFVGSVPLSIVLTALGMWLVLSALLLSDVVHRSAVAVANKLRLRVPMIPRIRGRELLAVLPPFVLSWACWIAGFSLFASALTGTPPSVADGLAFALAATLGILAVFAPGGLGVREGVLAGLLVLLGTSTADSTTLAVQSRIWFLFGEGTIFLIGLLARSPGRTAE